MCFLFVVVVSYIAATVDCFNTVNNDCSRQPCFHNGTCIETLDGYTCVCELGFEGKDCRIDTDECVYGPCENGGTCFNTEGSYTCSCSPGYTGKNCSEVIIDCNNNPCHHRAFCTNIKSGYRCTCAAGYQGPQCEKEINECAAHPCKNGGTCIDQVNSYTCVCLHGFRGKQCEINIDDCESSPCENNGTCIDGFNQYLCICKYGTSGDKCQTIIDKDDCLSNPCLNGGICIDGILSYTCNCTDFYKGVNCQTHCRYIKADIVMLLDSSGSIGFANFRKLKTFTSSVANRFDIGPANVHMSVVTFSSGIHNQFDLNQMQSRTSLLDAINKVPYIAGSTLTNKGLDYLIRHSFTLSAGDRPDAPNIAIVITDGQSSDKAATYRSAQALHQAGVTTVAIGIGSGIDLQELNVIASRENLVFSINDFDALSSIQNLLNNKICEVSDEPVPVVRLKAT